MLEPPRLEGELFWYHDIFNECSQNQKITVLPPAQEPVLFMAEDVTVTTRGDVLSLDGQEGILDTLQLGVCHRAM